MKKKFLEQLEIPASVQCEISNNILKCKKDSVTLEKNIGINNVKISLKDNNIVFDCPAGNKNEYKKIKSQIAHIKNMFAGVDKKYVYKLESVFVHFPVTLKVEKDSLFITNFLGEKTPRVAKILPGVDVELKGQKITVSSHNKESAGQTAANFEKATKIRCRDRRIFQDGIFLTEKSEANK